MSIHIGLLALALAAAPPPIGQALADGQSCTTASNAPLTATAWPGVLPDLTHAWALSQGAGITVAVLDTGVAGGMPQLAGRVSGAGADCVGHGTFVAGLIAAATDPKTGFSGMAPQAHIDAVPVTDQLGDTSPDQIAHGIDAAVAAHAQVIDVSVATPATSPALQRSVAAAIAAGSVVIAPATLDGQLQSGVVYPAACPGVLSVADLGSGGSGQQVTGAPVGVAAPGDDVIGPGIGGGAMVGSGASYATAFVAGAAALVDSYLGPMPPKQLIARLEDTAIHAAGSLPDPEAGYGLVDPFAALSTVDSVPGTLRSRAGQHTVMTMPPPPSRAASHTAVAVAATAVAVLVLTVFAMLTAFARSRRPRAHPRQR